MNRLLSLHEHLQVNNLFLSDKKESEISRVSTEVPNSRVEMSTMKALLLTRPDPTKPPVLTLETVPNPELQEGHVLVQVHASAIQ